MMPLTGTEIVRGDRVARTVRAAQPIHQAAHMNLHGALADPQPPRYSFPAQVLAAYELHDLALPRR